MEALFNFWQEIAIAYLGIGLVWAIVFHHGRREKSELWEAVALVFLWLPVLVVMAGVAIGVLYSVRKDDRQQKKRLEEEKKNSESR